MLLNSFRAGSPFPFRGRAFFLFLFFFLSPEWFSPPGGHLHRPESLFVRVDARRSFVGSNGGRSDGMSHHHQYEYREHAFVGYTEKTGEAREGLMVDERNVLVLKDVRFGGGDDVGGNRRRIRIRLLERKSPKIVDAFKEFGRNGVLGTFYRSEAVPEVGAIDNYGGPGPPYALIQATQNGRMNGGRMPREFAPMVERGYVCLIGEGPDWFIAIGSHHEWGHGHSVWGIVEDDESLEVADAITRLPIRHEKWGQTNVTVLLEKVSFQYGIEEVGYKRI